MDSYVKGHYKRSIFESSDGYYIGIFKVSDTNIEEYSDYIGRTITFTGYFENLNENDLYTLYGSFVNHSKYGLQFNTVKYNVELPETKDGIIEFLSSDIFKGVGEKTASNIVEKLGDDALSKILDNPSCLGGIPGVTKKTSTSIYNTLLEYSESYETIVKLNEIGFSNKDAVRIYNKYRSKTLDIIDKDIYVLMRDFIDISFKSLDKIFLEFNDRDDLRRIKAGIIYSITTVCDTMGHSYLLYDEVFEYTKRAISTNISNSRFDEALSILLNYGDIIEYDNKYYIKKMYDAEVTISRRLRILSSKDIINYDNIDKEIDTISHMFDIKYNDMQLEAIKSALTCNTCVITGGPGSGKTTIIKTIVELYKRLNKLSNSSLKDELFLLAPTGRASKRLSETTLLEAYTIHRFLKWNKETNKFAINEFSKSPAKIVIVDESSMVDTYLLDSLIRGLYSDCKIILVGDVDQLPSVGPGEVLKDIIDSNRIKVVRLNEIYRQNSNSNIISLAYSINRGEIDNSLFNKRDDLTFINATSNNLKVKLIELLSNNMDKNVQVLVPMYKTYNGIDNLNETIKELFNKTGDKSITINTVKYDIGDKIIQLSNMPDDNVFNGDIGYIYDIKTSPKKEVVIDFDGNLVKYTPSNFGKFKHAYAISIHKSQGSEFNTVIIPILPEYNKMLYKKLIYTAVTRAKKHLIIIGDINSLEYSAHINNVDDRRTTLKEMLLVDIVR